MKIQPTVRYTPNSPYAFHPIDGTVILTYHNRIWAIVSKIGIIGQVPKSVSIPDFGSFWLPPAKVDYPDGVYLSSVSHYHLIGEVVKHRLTKMIVLDKNYLTGEFFEFEWGEAQELTDAIVDNIITTWTLTGRIPERVVEEQNV